jgi:voltage-gated potassium channel Kch
MSILAAIAGILLLIVILQDAFETVVLPRRVARKFRFARLFYLGTWALWSGVVRKKRLSDRREFYLSVYGPLSLLILLILWACALIVAFALLQWSLGTKDITAPEKVITFTTDLYMSGTTFFTLGYGDVVPREGLARLCSVVEAGLGFGFLAIIIGYVPVIYQAFSRREAQITLLDARAGSPPSAAELLRRHIKKHDYEGLTHFLQDWEHWCAELLESHLSYTVLAYYRSQHDRQSWLAALTTVLDVCALVIIGLDAIPVQAGYFTFAIARHAAVDLAQIFGTPPHTSTANRLPSEEFARLRDLLADLGITIRDEETAEARLAALRHMYEPYVAALAEYLLTPLPAWITTEEHVDDWQASPWDTFSTLSQRPLPKVKSSALR